MQPPSPQLATPNGISFPSIARPSALETRLPIWATPTTAPIFGSQIGSPNKGSNVLESRANGFPNQRIPSSDGEWTGQVGESGWKSTKPEVIAATGGKPIPYKKGFPDFGEWIVDKVKLPKMKGNRTTDFDEADKIYAQMKGWFKANGKPDLRRVEQMRKDQNLTWHHHQDMTTMELVPKDLNNKVPHTGGASLVKKNGN